MKQKYLGHFSGVILEVVLESFCAKPFFAGFFAFKLLFFVQLRWTNNITNYLDFQNFNDNQVNLDGIYVNNWSTPPISPPRTVTLHERRRDTWQKMCKKRSQLVDRPRKFCLWFSSKIKYNILTQNDEVKEKAKNFLKIGAADVRISSIWSGILNYKISFAFSIRKVYFF